MGRSRHAWWAIASAALVAAVATWVGPAAPAGAITVSSSGTTVTATVVNTDRLVRVSCVGGQVRVGGTAASPSVACTALTRLVFVGGSGGQYVDTRDVGAAFPAINEISIALGAGHDKAYLGPERDVVDLGSGSDEVEVVASGTPDGLLAGGGGGDRMTVVGRTVADTVTLTDGATAGDLRVVSGTWRADLRTDFTTVRGDAGPDTIDASTVDAIPADTLTLDGGTGDDTLRGAQVGTFLRGGTGTNLLVGGADDDRLASAGPADTLDGRGGTDALTDSAGPVGGRTIVPGDPGDAWYVSIEREGLARTRPAPGGGVEVTAARGRSGRQVVPPGIASVGIQLGYGPVVQARSVIELTALTDITQTITSYYDSTLIDVIVPSGTATVGPESMTFSAGYGSITWGYTELPPHVRPPYTDPEERFAHRIVRDLEGRIPSDAERTSLADALDAGSTTRAAVVAEITGGSTYVARLIDRAYVSVLERIGYAEDHAYWGGRIGDGLIVRKLWANLYGSPDYFAQVGRSDVPTYVAAVYQDVLGRTPGASEVAYWAGLIQRGTARGTVADRFLNTPEARAAKAIDLYWEWADRAPTSAEVTAASAQLRSSTVDGELALVRALAAGPDYAARPDPTA